MALYRLKNKVQIFKRPFHDLNWLESLAIIFSIWFIIYPVYYELIASMILVIPLMGLILNWIKCKRNLAYSNRPSLYTLVRIAGRKEGDHVYEVVNYFSLPALALMIRVCLDYRNIFFSHFFLVGSLVFLFFSALIAIAYRINFYIPSKRKRVYLAIITTVVMYAYSGSIALNCLYDDSEAELYPSRIIEARSSMSSKGGERLQYYILIDPKFNKYGIEEIKVSRTSFYNMKDKEEVTLHVKKGCLNIPWYYLESAYN